MNKDDKNLHGGDDKDTKKPPKTRRLSKEVRQDYTSL